MGKYDKVQNFIINLTEGPKLLDDEIIKKMKNFMSENPNDRSSDFLNFWIAFMHLTYRRESEYLIYLQKIENVKDEFFEFLGQMLHSLYFGGFNSLVISKEKSQKAFDKCTELVNSMENNDLWVLGMTKMYYFYLCEVRESNDVIKAIEWNRKAKEEASKIPINGEMFAKGYDNDYGLLLRSIGRFDEAETALRTQINNSPTINFELMAKSNLIVLLFIKKRLKEAKTIIYDYYNTAVKYNLRWQESIGLRLKGRYFESLAEYPKATDFYEEALLIRKVENLPYLTAYTYFDLIRFFVSAFKSTEERIYLRKANSMFLEMKEFMSKNINDDRIVNLLTLSLTMINRYGNLRNRAKAADDLENLYSIYGDEFELSIIIILTLLELLFEDVQNVQDDETIQLIKSLMVKLAAIPLRNNPSAVDQYISQQIVLAKYEFFILGEIDSALNGLLEVREHISKYNIDFLTQLLNKEIIGLEKEVNNWSQVSLTIQERIKSSQFHDYLNQAMDITNYYTE